MQWKGFGDVDVIPNRIHGKRYHIMALKEPEYVMLMMMTYGTLYYLEGSHIQNRCKGLGRHVVTLQFNHCEVFDKKFQ